MNGYDNRDRFPSHVTGQEGDNDTPLTDLKMYEENLKAGISAVFLKNGPLANSLGRDGVDFDEYGMHKALLDVIDDYLGLELMRLENME